MNRPVEHKPEKILRAASSLFMADGINVSTARVAEAAGVANGTLFNHFPTKQDLIDALYVSIKTDLGGAIGVLDESDPIEDRMYLIWSRWLDWAGANREAHTVMNLLHQSGLASEKAQSEAVEALKNSVSILDEAARAGLLVDLPLDYLGAVVQHHLDQAVASALNDKQTRLAFQVLWNGIAKPSAHPQTKA